MSDSRQHLRCPTTFSNKDIRHLFRLILWKVSFVTYQKATIIKTDSITETDQYGTIILYKLLAKLSVSDMTLPMRNITMQFYKHLTIVSMSIALKRDLKMVCVPCMKKQQYLKGLHYSILKNPDITKRQLQYITFMILRNYTVINWSALLHVY